MIIASNSTSTKAEHQVEGRIPLKVIVLQYVTVLQLPASIDEALLFGGNA
jgi:hypothetical protein